jgi:DNA-binding transcriptional MerR regulator
MTDLLDIGDVASRSGMPPSTLRFYEREGLIESAERKGLRRQFDAGVLDILAVVALCRQAGFSLAEIQSLLATGGDPGWKGLAARKRDEVRAQIERMAMVADRLDHAMTCPSSNLFECEHFKAALQEALPVADGIRSSRASA